MEFLSRILASAIGASIAGVFTLAVYMYRLNRDRKKTINRALFALLRIWGPIRKMVQADEKKTYEKMSIAIVMALYDVTGKQAKRIVDHPGSEDFTGLAKTIIGENAKEWIPQITLGGWDEAIREHVAATEALSEEEPLLAHKIGTQLDVRKAEEDMDDFINTSFNALDTKDHPEDDDLNVDQFGRLLIGDVTEIRLDSLEESIRTLAWKSSLRTWWQVRKKLKRLRIADRDAEEMAEEIESTRFFKYYCSLVSDHADIDADRKRMLALIGEEV